MKMKYLIAIALTMASVTFFACKKEASSEQTNFRVRMTDAPVNADEVNIDLREVQVKYQHAESDSLEDNDSTDMEDSSATHGWVKLDTHAGIYNLLDLQNGLDTMIAQGNLPTGQFVKEIRLIVGSNNTIKIDSSVYPLRIPSGAETGLKIKINKKLQASFETVVIDFDAALSIKEENGNYMLRPVLKVK
jgi:hypothetical protein